ncbi:hypothetical protein RHSIM_Rhsim02G0161600 [Rhododendron simsii]|uniref:Uncharacterized protein n=1 Tax=Rhododendron simsii TaxID=118357 RepID=A0A834LS63_RHOSS|nr:hypothetical protein RHSIM_Rhsim02G0161600 [Rhododendron simsii]
MMNDKSCMIWYVLQRKRDIGAQWKSQSNEERQKYKYLAEAAKEELVKQKELFPEEPKKVKVKQRNAVHAIGLGGILQLRCKFMNHELCNWLVGKFDPACCSLTVHRRTFVLTEAHVEECFCINAQCTVIDLEGNTLDACVEVGKNVGLTNRVVQLKDLREYLDKTEEFDDVFKRKIALYILGCFLCPNTKAGVTRSLINAVSDDAEMTNQNWVKLTLQFLCDDEIKRVLHQFDKIGGDDREGVVVVHFTQVGEPSGNMSGVSQISTADVQTMTSTFVNVAGFLLRQNMIMAKLLRFEIQSNPQAKTEKEMDVSHVKLFGHALALMKGLQSCQRSPPILFETPDLVMNESNSLSTNPSFRRDIGFEMPLRSKLEGEMAQQIDVEPVHPSARSSPQKRIQVDMDEDVCSPSPVKGFRSIAGLSRGRKKKLQNGNPVLSVGGYDNVEVHYAPPRLRQPDQLKKSHFHCSPFTEDGVKKRNPPKKQPVNEKLDNLDVNIPTVSVDGILQRRLCIFLPNTKEMADDARKPIYEPLTDHEKLFTEFIFDIHDPSNG